MIKTELKFVKQKYKKRKIYEADKKFEKSAGAPAETFSFKCYKHEIQF